MTCFVSVFAHIFGVPYFTSIAKRNHMISLILIWNLLLYWKNVVYNHLRKCFRQKAIEIFRGAMLSRREYYLYIHTNKFSSQLDSVKKSTVIIGCINLDKTEIRIPKLIARDWFWQIVSGKRIVTLKIWWVGM